MYYSWVILVLEKLQLLEFLVKFLNLLRVMVCALGGAGSFHAATVSSTIAALLAAASALLNFAVLYFENFFWILRANIFMNSSLRRFRAAHLVTVKSLCFSSMISARLLTAFLR